MATQTKIISHMNEPAFGGSAVIELDWSDSSFRLQAIRCINTADHAVALTARATADGTEFSTTFPANATTTRNIPGGQAAKFGVTIDARGRVDGIEYSAGWIL